MNNKRVECIDQIKANGLRERDVPDTLNQLPTAGNRKMVDPVRIWWPVNKAHLSGIKWL